MTKLERAIQEAGKLPAEVQEQLGDDLLHFIDKFLTLRDDLDTGIRELDAGEKIPAGEVFAEIKALYGA